MRILFLFILFASSISVASISPRTYNTLTDLQDRIAAQPNSETAQNINNELIELADDLQGNSLGLALTYQTHAQLMSYLDKPKEMQALLLKAVSLKDLESTTLNQIRTMLAYSYFNEDAFIKAINVLKEVIKDEKQPSANTYALIAASYYSLGDYRSGLPFIEQACDLAKTPKEAWLQMAFSGSYQLKNYKKAGRYVDLLVFNFPENKNYWQQKAGLHQMMDELDIAAATKELSYKQGYLEKDSDFINLGQLLASQGVPFKVAQVLELAIKNGVIEVNKRTLNLLFQSWLQAKEIDKAILVLADLYQRFSDSSHGYQILQYYIDQEDWERSDRLASKLLDAQLTKSQEGKVLLYQGMAKYRLGDIRGAMLVLGKSTAFESSSSQAKSWMSYIKQMSS